jgi:hypothetical protein
MIQTIHEIEDKFDAYAKHLGYCLVMFMFAGSPTSNPQFLVKLYHSGDIRMVDQNDLKLYGNPNAGEKLIPDIPEDWKPENKINK